MSRPARTSSGHLGARRLVVVGAVAGLMTAAHAFSGSHAARTASAPTDLSAASDASRDYGYERVLRDLDAEIEVRARYAGAQRDSWLRQTHLASALLDRARLTGDLDDYARASESVDRAFALRGGHVGPFALRATLASSLHRLDDARADLARALAAPVITPRAESELRSMLGDLAAEAGHHATATREYEHARSLYESHTVLARLALAADRRGAHTEADALFVEAAGQLAKADRRSRGWIELQRGISDLSRGRYEEARAHYVAADAIFPGFWLIEEHRAEVEALLGRHDEAIARYRRVVARTHKPELMDALAKLLRDRSPDEARALADGATERFERALTKHPAAMAAHAAEHYLDVVPRPLRALELATANHRARPNPDAEALLDRARRATAIAQHHPQR